MTLAIRIAHVQGNLRLDLAFESSGPLTALYGASGSGKTTIVNIIAGLVKPDMATIRIGDHLLTDTARGLSLPAHRRRIGYVFQDARLFPHMTVAQNLAYGRWFAPQAERYADHDRIVDLLDIGHLLARKPVNLSGGEKQRVAIGRALLASPRLLLMDEPLASLDQARKDEVLPHIEALRDELRIPIVYVSHAMAEVTRLANDVAVIADGRLVAFGSTPDVVRRLDIVPPEDREETGAVIDMVVDSYDEAFRMTRLTAPAGVAWLPGRAADPGQSLRLRIRARDVMIATAEPHGISALNVFRGTIAAIAPGDDYSVYVNVDCGGVIVVARLTRKSCAALDLEPGRPVFAMVKALSLIGSASTPRPAPSGLT